ncbi:hypothetical protein, partial [Thiolapillus sp.]|uniref:hypothetical protein n=1 Tax=Thiolapillus sp. TaxID=2017437 RepID=UPI003AF74282
LVNPRHTLTSPPTSTPQKKQNKTKQNKKQNNNKKLTLLQAMVLVISAYRTAHPLLRTFSIENAFTAATPVIKLVFLVV